MALSDDAEHPPCPDCGTNVLVARAYNDNADFVCHGCEAVFDTPEDTEVNS